MPAHLFENGWQFLKGHKITDKCPFCRTKCQDITYTRDFKNKISYYTCEKCGEQWLDNPR